MGWDMKLKRLIRTENLCGIFRKTSLTLRYKEHEEFNFSPKKR